MEILFPHDKFLDGKILPGDPRTPNPLPPNAKKCLLKTSVHFIITITICKQWSKFVAYSPSPGNCGELIHPQRHSY